MRASLPTRRMLACAGLLLAGCDLRAGESDAPQTVQVVHASPSSPTPVTLPAAAPQPTAPAHPSPRAVSRSLADMQPRKTFTDPPLPAELRDDGGLLPLPPRPTP